MLLIGLSGSQLVMVRHLLAPLAVVAAMCAYLAAASGFEQAATVETLAVTPPLSSRGRLGGVSMTADGSLIVSNFDRHVWRVTPDGRATLLTDQLQGTSGNTVAPDGRVLQASFVDGRVVAFDEGGGMVTVAGGFDGPVGLTFDTAGRLVVCNCRGNTLSVVSRDGEVGTLASGPLFACPNGITRGPGGSLYVVNFSNPHVLEVAPGGEVSVLTSFPGGGNAHVAFAGGALYVTRIETNEVVRVRLDGSFERWAGTGEVGLADGPRLEATLARPNGITASADGRFLFVNNLDGEWRSDRPATLVMRRLGPLTEASPPVPLPEPADIVPIEIPVGGLVFDALAAGPPNGDLVFLLHGFPQTADAFRAQLGALGGAGYRVLAPNQRGYSPRARPDGVAAYAIGNLVTDVLGMADALGAERFHLVGHDWGGAVAWVAALRAPDRIRSLTVLSTPHFAALSAARASAGGDQAARSSYFSGFAEPGAEMALLAADAAGLRAIYSGLDPDAIDRYLAALGQPEVLRAALAWYAAAFGGTSAAGSAATAAPAAPPPIRVPTLYVWSTEDTAFGREAALGTAAFVAGPYRFEVIEGVGHWLPELVPERVTQLILDQVREHR